MSRVQSFKLHPLSRALKVLSITPLLLFAQMSQARVLVPGEVLNIDGSTAPDNYVLNGASTLNADGATTRQIVVNASTLNLSNSTVQATGANGVFMSAGTAVIDNSVINSDRVGMSVSRPVGSTQGSTVTARDTTFNGAQGGILTSALSTLILERSTMNGTGANAYAMTMFSGTVVATDSTFNGNGVGIVLAADPSLTDPSTLTLNNSHVTGRNGEAISVNGTTANIEVLNGSTLSGSNGILLNIANGATGNLRVGNSTLVGDIVADGSSTANVVLDSNASLTGRLVNVQSLGVNSGASWVMVEDGAVNDLSLNGGNIKFGNPTDFYKLTVGNLSGNGNFIMDADFSTGQIDTLEVTGNATGNHTLLIGSSGQDPLADKVIPVVHIAGGDATFSLLNGPVDVGTFSYELMKQGANDWVLDTTSRVISPGTRSVLALFNTAPTVWYGELSTLRTRMGEVRRDNGKAGGWIRTYGNRFDVSARSGVDYKQTQQGISFGADAPLPMGDGQWLMGLFGGYSKSDLDLQRGTSGTVDSYSLGGYVTWLDERSGYYFDGVLKYNRFNNESDVQLSDGTKTSGNYDNNGVGASAEFGRHIKLDDGYFVEPYAQVAGVVIQGKDYDLGNGLAADGSRTRSLLAEAGATVGRNLKWDDMDVQPYLRAAYVHEFANNNEVKVNNNVFNNDLSGSRGKLGAGVSLALTDKVSVHADFEYSNGDKVDQPWGANVGVRYFW